MQLVLLLVSQHLFLKVDEAEDLRSRKREIRVLSVAGAGMNIHGGILVHQQEPSRNLLFLGILPWLVVFFFTFGIENLELL